MIAPPPFSSLTVSLWLAVAPADAGAPPGTRDRGPPPSLLAPLTLKAPRPTEDEYLLRRTKDGSGDLVYEAPGFTARVARDGAVTFSDRHIGRGVHILPMSPLPSRTRYGVPSLEETIRNHGRHRPEPPADAPPPDEIANPSTHVSRYRPDVREICRYPQPCFVEAPALALGASATLDITDEIMRMAHQDPYRYAKARFLTATREMRVRMATRAHKQDLRRSAAELPALLQRIACDDRMSLTDRRAIIESLRGEMDLSTAEGGAAASAIGRFLETFTAPDGGAAGNGPACPPP
jgi:hypothetical protein